MSELRIRPAGDRAVLLELPDSAAAATVAVALRTSFPQLVDVVPGHRTVLATWSGDEPAGLGDAAARALAREPLPPPRAVIVIPVTYDGPDLVAVADLTGRSVDDTVALHCEPLYTVGFLGFAPGFAYLLGGSPRLQPPRRLDPRTHVPAGSVAVAGPYSGIYPRDGPGGWQLIGRTAFVPFDAERAEPAALAPGDRVRFEPA